MEKNKKYKLDYLKVVSGIQFAIIKKWFSDKFKFGKNAESLSLDSNGRIQYVEDIIDDSCYEKMPYYNDKKTELFDLLIESADKEVQENIDLVNGIFTSKKFIFAYCIGSNEAMIKLIEDYYWQGRINSLVLKYLVKTGVIVLTEADKKHFEEIGLSCSWDDDMGDNPASLS